MVFDYQILDASGKTVRIGQLHVNVSPLNTAHAFAEALIVLGNWINTHKHLIRREPASITLRIATI